MVILLTCPHGHQFEAVDPGPAACPQCGAAIVVPPDRMETLSQPAAAPLPDPDRTLDADAASPGRAEGATLAPGAYAGPGPDDLAVPGYEVLGELGRGGMGVVYLARHVELRRLVALKMVLAGDHAGAQEIARFGREAEAVARLQHPHIVRIYEMGEHQGRPFFALEYIDGGSLSQWLNGKPVPASQAAALVAKLARAVHYAHEHGILHRDLKPGNILLRRKSEIRNPKSEKEPAHTVSDCGLRIADFEPMVADFGLAKQLGDGASASAATHWASQTQSGAILGTPSYMAPEQAGANRKAVGPAADTYALGAILYELLTGRPPFEAATPLDTVLKLLSEELTPPRSLAPGLPRDLETVCLKCLAKEPGKRYASAAELADDLERFLRDEPVRARRAGAIERTGRWLRRRPIAAVSLLLLVAALVWGAVRYGPSLYRKALNQGRLVVKAPTAGVRVRVHPEGGGPALMEVGEGRVVTLLAGDYELELAEGQGGMELASERITVAPDGWHEIQVRLTPEGEVGRFEGHTGPVHGLAVSPDGRLVLSASGFPQGDQTLRLWDLRSRTELRRFEGHKGDVMCAAFTPDGKRAVSGGADGIARLWDVDTGKELRQFHGHTATILTIAFSADGRRFLTGSHDASMRLWDVDSGAQIGLFDDHANSVLCVAFLPDGRRAVSASHDSTVRLWDLESGIQLRRLQADGHSPEGLALSPDGRLAAASGFDKSIRVWDLNTGRLVRRLLGHTNVVSTVAFSPDGRYLVSGSMDRTVRLWDVAAGAEVHSFEGHADGIRAVAFTPDGWRILSGGGAVWDKGQWSRGTDFDVRVWGLPHSLPAPSEPAVEPAVEVRRLAGPAPGTASALVSPDGRRLVFGCMDGTVRLWDFATGQEIGRLVGHKGHAAWALAWSPDSRHVLTGGEDGTVRLWDAATGRERVRCTGHQGLVWSVALAPDGRRALSGGFDKTVRLWDLNSGQELARFTGHTGVVRRVAFAPDGRTALTCGSEDKEIRQWDLSAIPGPLVDWQRQLGLFLAPAPRLPFAAFALPPVRTKIITKESRLLEGHTAGVQCVAFMPDGRRAVSAGHDWTVRVWDLETGDNRRLDGHSNGIDSLAVSADGKRVLSGSFDGVVLCWDLESGRELSFCAAHSKTATSVSFAPGSRFVTSCTQEPEIRVWQLPEPGESPPTPLEVPLGTPLPQAAGEVVRFAGHRDGLASVAVSADGRWALTGSGFKVGNGQTGAGLENEVRLWDAASGMEVRRFRGHTGLVFRVLFTRDGKRALSAGADGTVRLWDLDTGKEVRGFGDHGGEVRALALSADGKQLATGTVKGVTRVFEVATGKLVQTFPEVGQVWSLAFSPDGKQVVAGTAQDLRLGDLETGQWLKTMTGHTHLVRDVFFLAEGKRIVSAGDDATVRQWDVASGEEVSGAPSQTSGIMSMAVEPGGRHAVTGAFDGGVRLWDLNEGRELHHFTGHVGMVHGVAFLPDGNGVISACIDKTARRWRLREESAAPAGPEQITVASAHPGAELVVKQDGKVVLPRTANRQLELPPGRYELELAQPAEDLRLAPKWLTVEAGETQEVQIRRVPVVARSPACVRTLEGHAAMVRRVAFAPDGKHALSAGFDGTWRLWDVTTGQELRRFSGHDGRPTGVAFTPDGRNAFLTSDRDRTLRLWDVKTGKEVRRYQGHTEGIWNVSVAGDGRRAVTCSADRTVRLWDVETGKQLQCFRGHTGWVEDAALSPDGKLVVSCNNDKEVRLWDVKTGELVRPLVGHTGSVFTAGFSPDSSQVLTAGMDGTVRLWNAASGAEVRRFAGHVGALAAATFSPDGKRILTCGEDRLVRLWDTATGKELASLRGHANPIFSVAFSPDGRQALSGGGGFLGLTGLWGGGADFDIRLWTLPDPR